MLTKRGYAKAEFPIITRPSASTIALRSREFGGVLRDEPTRKVFFGLTITPWDEVLSVQTDARLLANNSQHCWMLHVLSFCSPCCMLLGVVAQSLKPVKLLAMCKRTQQLPTLLALWTIYLHVANVLVGGRGFRGKYCRANSLGDYCVPIVKKKTKTSGSNAGCFDTEQVISVNKRKPSRWFFVHCIGFEKTTNL